MTNPVRTCIGCAQTDDHPRHVIATPDGANVSWHLDCHRIAGNCEICTEQLLDAPDGVTGDELRTYLLTTGPGPDQPGWTAPIDAVEG